MSQAGMSNARVWQIVLIASFLMFSWLGFMVVHEFGHVVTAWLTGGAISRVVLHPLQISWTAFTRNPHPQLVAWGGPVLGSLLPLGIFAAAHRFRLPGWYMFRFFAGFCLVANGLYLLVDAFERGGDGGTLLRHGASEWQLVVFGTLAAISGFWWWHGLGKYFGLGAGQGHVDLGAVLASTCLLALVVVVELVCYT